MTYTRHNYFVLIELRLRHETYETLRAEGQRGYMHGKGY